MCASNFTLNWGKAPQKLSKLLIVVLERTQWEEKKFLNGFLRMFKSGMISAEDAKCSGHTFMRKT